MVEFFHSYNEVPGDPESVPSSGDLTILSTVFLFLFMDSTSSSKKKISVSSETRCLAMSKFISLAMSLNSRTILHCAGTWIDQQGPTSDRPLQLAQFIVDRQILLIPECGPAMEMIKKLPEIVPLFIAGFMTSITELYFSKSDNPPPKRLVDLVASWMTNSTLLPLRPVLLPGSVSSSPQTPLMGLAKWTVLAAIFQQVII